MTVASRCGDRPATEHHRSAGRLHRLSEAGGLSRAPGRHLATALAAPMAGGTAFFDALAAGGDPAKRTIQRTRRRSGREGVRPLLHLTARPEARTGTSRARVHVWGEHPPAKQPRTRSKQESGRRESNSRSQLGKLSPRRPHTSVNVHQRRSQGCLRRSACTRVRARARRSGTWRARRPAKLHGVDLSSRLLQPPRCGPTRARRAAAA
jgi:hypothetical protein